MPNLDFETIFARIIVLVVAFTVHELSHAIVADRMGDPTPRQMGRLTLNPLAHLDLFGSLMLVISGFGWAKPVRVQPLNLKGEPFTSMALVAAAGPISNILMAFVAVILLRIDLVFLLMGHIEPARLLTLLLLEFVLINLVLAFFNVLPIPPLDGFKVLMGAVPPRVALELKPMERYGFLILIIIIFAVPQITNVLVWRPAMVFTELLLGSDGLWQFYYELTF